MEKRAGKKIFQEKQGSQSDNDIRFTKNDKVYIYNREKLHKIFDIGTNKYLTGLKAKMMISGINSTNAVKDSIENMLYLPILLSSDYHMMD